MLSVITISIIVLGMACTQSAKVPESWMKNWQNPPAEDRPLQITHGIPPERASLEGMKYYKDLGLGGIVCNVAFQQYLQSEENWKTLVDGVDACSKLGMVVWIYDEQGYPSGGAGGLVLKKNPEYEAMELAFDEKRSEPFIVRPAYEFTHASNNYHAARRYVNLIDDRGIKSFTEVTHDAYWKRLEPYFGKTIQAMFTDEPSLIAINIGQIPEQVRKTVRVDDPINPKLRMLPCVPWGYDLAERYKERYNEDLVNQRWSLFTGDSEQDRKVRRQYWALIADLTAKRFFGQLQDWCKAHGIASSGHTLHEEQIMPQVALEGNALKMLAAMDIPGLDMLSSDPAVVINAGWLTAGLPTSAAVLNNRRRVMTEISDFSQKMSGKGPAGLAEMQAAAAWEAAWGVTDFTLYYNIETRSGMRSILAQPSATAIDSAYKTEDHPAKIYQAYCDYVGRLNAVLKPAQLDSKVLLYYPIYDLWAEYKPVAEPFNIKTQSERARNIVGSFMRLGRLLQRAQIPFIIVDHEYLAKANVQPDGKIAIGNKSFKAVLIPRDAELPTEADKVIEQFKQSGGNVVVDDSVSVTKSSESLIEILKPEFRIEPVKEQIALGQFNRDGQTILLLLNTGTEVYEGNLIADKPGNWIAMNPASGEMKGIKNDGGKVGIKLAGREAVMMVGGR